MKDVIEDSVKSLGEVKVDNLHCSSLINPSRHAIMDGYQIGQV